MVELRALGESNSRLLAIGRNLNQIARQANLDRRTPDRLTKEHIDAVHQVIARTKGSHDGRCAPTSIGGY